ncbi:hypothetical protein BVY04_02565 [bacterium M21]|nr:hypothetical protein BVY04_02565 [bacterium M21]
MVVFLAAVILSICASPYLVTYKFGLAIQEKDEHAVNEQIRYPVLQRNLKEWVTRHFASAESELNFSQRFMKNSIIGFIDSHVQPERMADLLHGRNMEQVELFIRLSGVQTSSESNVDINDFYVSGRGYEGVNRFTVYLSDTNRPIMKLIFTRHSVINWKMTDILLVSVNTQSVKVIH